MVHYQFLYSLSTNVYSNYFTQPRKSLLITEPTLGTYLCIKKYMYNSTIHIIRIRILGSTIP